MNNKIFLPFVINILINHHHYKRLFTFKSYKIFFIHIRGQTFLAFHDEYL